MKDNNKTGTLFNLVEELTEENLKELPLLQYTLSKLYASSKLAAIHIPDVHISSKSKILDSEIKMEIPFYNSRSFRIAMRYFPIIIQTFFRLIRLFNDMNFLSFNTSGKNKYDLTIQSWIYKLSEENRAYLIDSYNSWLEGKTKTWITFLQAKIFIIRFILQDVLYPKVSYKIQRLIRPIHKPRL